MSAGAGNGSAFEALYHEHLPQIYGLCLRMTGDESMAADLTQDIFIRIWKQLSSFQGGNFGGWIYTLGRNVILNDQRARKRFAALVTFEDDVAAVEPPGPRISRETALTISSAIETLPPRGQVVFRMHDVEGYSAEEIGEFLGLSPATVRVHLHRSRKRLASVLLS
ncbi:MAG: RNA polymerase sigma factor [Gemmatimonadales bacterium]